MSQSSKGFPIEVFTELALDTGRKTAKPGYDYIGTAAVGVVFHPESALIPEPKIEELRFIITLRGPEARHSQGTWEIPGGKIELQETSEAAFIREVKEETGLEILYGSTKCVGAFDDFCQDGAHWVSLVYVGFTEPACTICLEPGKVDDYQWVTFPQFFERVVSNYPLMENIETAVSMVYDYFQANETTRGKQGTT